MNFSSWKIENDIYLYFWIVYLKPILDYNNTYEKFIEINSSWADFSEYNNFFEENKGYIKYTSLKEKTTKSIPSPLHSEVLPLKKEEINVFIKIINNLIKKIFLSKTLRHFEKI